MLVWLHAPPQHCTLWHNLMNFWDTLGLRHPPDGQRFLSLCVPVQKCPEGSVQADTLVIGYVLF